jgi:hypothetical protein
MRALLLFLVCGFAVFNLAGCENERYDPCCAWNRFCDVYCPGSAPCVDAYTTDPQQCRTYLSGDDPCLEVYKQEAIADCTK